MGKIEYINAFHAAVGPAEHTRALGLEWAETGQPLEVAIAWATRNYLPGEALRHIDAGRTPEEANAIDDAVDAEDAEAGAIAIKARQGRVHKAVRDADGNVTGFEELY